MSVRSQSFTIIDSVQPAGSYDTVDITFKTYDETRELVDHTFPVIYIYDPNGTLLVDGASMTASSTGLSIYNYTLGASPTEGTYRVICKGTVTIGVTNRVEASKAFFLVSNVKRSPYPAA